MCIANVDVGQFLLAGMLEQTTQGRFTSAHVHCISRTARQQKTYLLPEDTGFLKETKYPTWHHIYKRLSDDTQITGQRS